MKPRVKLAESTFTGGILSLVEHDGSYSISLDGKELMHSRANESELLLGSLGVARLGNKLAGRVLIGGLGLGYTLKGVLDSVGDKTIIEVAEMIPEVIEWNRTHLKNLNGSLLDHPQVETRRMDVIRLIQEAKPNTTTQSCWTLIMGPMPWCVRPMHLSTPKTGFDPSAGH